MKIEQICTKLLVPYAKNAKKHSPEQVNQIAASITEFGFNNPVLVDGDEYGIIAGHGRVLAAQRIGLETVPCIRLSHLSPKQKRAYILADNRLSEIGGGWDEDILKIELKDMEQIGDIDLDLTGFDFFDRERILEGLEVESGSKEKNTQEGGVQICKFCGQAIK